MRFTRNCSFINLEDRHLLDAHERVVAHLHWLFLSLSHELLFPTTMAIFQHMIVLAEKWNARDEVLINVLPHPYNIDASALSYTLDTTKPFWLCGVVLGSRGEKGAEHWLDDHLLQESRLGWTHVQVYWERRQEKCDSSVRGVEVAVTTLPYLEDTVFDNRFWGRFFHTARGKRLLECLSFDRQRYFQSP